MTTSLIANILALKTPYNEVFVDNDSYTSAEIERCKNAGLPIEVWGASTGSGVDTAAGMLALDPYISGVTCNTLNAEFVIFENTFE